MLLNLARNVNKVWVRGYDWEGVYVETLLISSDPFPIGDRSRTEIEDDAWSYFRGDNFWEHLTQNHINFMGIAFFFLSTLATGLLLWALLLLTALLISPD